MPVLFLLTGNQYKKNIKSHYALLPIPTPNMLFGRQNPLYKGETGINPD